VDSLKVLDPEWPIREADIFSARQHVSKVPKAEMADVKLRKENAARKRRFNSNLIVFI
jgi:hypothetical protein